ncbi:MAG: SulP family inorganic anion transporter [Flavobacteriaceae bacterium]|nr:SulP family inorganic anion transporter [Muriicola sp.]MBT8290424.1 SulP family inorganic anion transporter [Muriicola sp.]NNC62469.1 SulP family inorganic anion transporter [Eudoraea sp.]NNK35622.1 SulP family inorganic anion transporter [Eudoraea sp.]NNL39200.1 SulP family inorganic anion transporter [Flavobacteriaceae bacterium]
MTVNKDQIGGFVKGLPKNIFSGFVVSLIALPLGLGLALASEAPPIAGIIPAVVGGILVAVLGGSHVTITGPGNGLVIVLLGAITTLGGGDLYQGYLFTLAAVICSGVLLMLLGFLKMGRLADFFPASTIQGMLAAIGIGILAKQFHIMIGHNNEAGNIMTLILHMPSGLYSLWESDGSSVVAAAIVGVISLMIMAFYGKIRSKWVHLIPAPMWILLLSIGFHYFCSFLALPYPIKKELLIPIPDNVLASLAYPDFGMALSQKFIFAVFAITLIAGIESLLSIKAVDRLDPANRHSNVNKDLKALGLATVISGFLGGLNVVTVIARSSVNVNTGATNRSANFFHALFLLAFVLLFQEQLRKIPLSALAAILVYTGYKLATPALVKRIAGVGKEQILIFFSTVLATLLTNLITGIAVGILVTFIIHVLVNKSVLLFITHLFKPNILMFREADGGNYFISVKHFCSFLNFYKLKNKLDAIRETEEVVLDFSMCSFVDHTVLEGLENYRQIFDLKGGHMELIGLDKHETDSVHPFAIRKIIPFRALKPIEWYFTKRQEDLKATAADFGWKYIPNKQSQTTFLREFVFFSSKEISYCYNQLEDVKNKVSVFDVEFTEGEFIAKEVIKSTVMYLPLPSSIPVFTLDKEGLLALLYNLSGFEEVEVPNHPDFSKRFRLSGEDPEGISEVFSDELVLFLESHPYYHVESNGNALLILKKERLLSVKEVKRMIYFGQQLKKILLQSEYAQ